MGIGLVLAHTPQAKGRIERVWGTFQDRLVSEMQLAGASTIEQAHWVLGDFLPRFNSRFGVPARQPGLAYRQLPPGACIDAVLTQGGLGALRGSDSRAAVRDCWQGGKGSVGQKGDR